MSIPDCDRHNPVEDPTDELDAYGHLTWTVGTVEDEDGDSWMACFDAVYDENTNRIRYEVVVDTGTSVGGLESGSVNPDNLEELRRLPDYWHSIGYEASGGLTMDEELLIETRKTWGDHLDTLFQQACDPEADEQSLDYFNRHIAGDR